MNNLFLNFTSINSSKIGYWLKNSDPYGPMSGQIMSAVKDGCRKAFQAQPQRLMAAMYSCSIQANAEILGKFCIFNLNRFYQF